MSFHRYRFIFVFMALLAFMAGWAQWERDPVRSEPRIYTAEARLEPVPLVKNKAASRAPASQPASEDPLLIEPL